MRADCVLISLLTTSLIRYELCCYFETAMERVIALADLRRDGPPQSFSAAFPSHAALIRWMMNADPSQRPTAREVMFSDCP